MSKNVTIITIVLVVILLTGGYLIFQNQKLKNELSGQISSPSPTVSPGSSKSPEPQSPSPSPSPKQTIAEIQENIIASINSGNTAALATYMTKPKVNFSLMSTECCEPQTPDEAVNQLSYISEGIPLDFNQQADLVKTLKAKNPQLANTFMGISKTGEQLAAFTIDNQNRISGVQLAVTWKLYSY